MEALIKFLEILNSLSPLAVIALLGTVIFLLVKGRTAVDTKVEHVANNHLHDLPELVDTLRRVEMTLQRLEVSISENFAYLRARLNGR